ncbi:MAG: thiamine pyrophosphate-dependent dehydrogenase E1 component subunit alpha [Deltaproteobacteria bacterium]|nr:thiamine pyrophosphate-dependent dehydrogenase E1 component subunit alpha [Deltaproteobacteria bacterium]
MKLKMYYTMTLIRRFEQRSTELFKNGKFPGWIHVSIGQEASATGACLALNENDYIGPTHRGHGQALAKGMDPKNMMAELYGKKTGCCLGRSGSMHMCDMSKGILCGNAILGAGLAFGAGVAMSSKLRKTDQVVLVFFGEGASNEGIVHETMNMAALWDLPIVFFCESNQYAELSHRDFHLKVDTIATRGVGYGMPGVTIDGNDVLEVYKTTSKAVKRARDGNGPTLIDSITCRWDGHYVGDPMVYRKEGDLEEWKKKDPILKLEKSLFKQDGILNKDGKQKMIEKIDQTIADAEEFAENSLYPEPEEALENVYC